MFKKINNLHLSILVIIASVLSLVFVQQEVLAQWSDPIGLPGETGVFHLVVNPMAEDLNLNNFSLFNSTDFVIDPAVSDKILLNTGNIRINNGQLCLNGDCRTVWPSTSSSAGESLWSTSTINSANIYYSDGKVGIGTNNPESALHIASSVVNGSDLRLLNTTGDMSIIFQEYPTDADDIGDFFVTYNGGTGGFANWLEFKGKPGSQNLDDGRPVMTLQRDYNAANNTYKGVGIGIPSGVNISSKLRVQNYGTEDILQLYDGNTLAFQVKDGGDVGIKGNTHSGVPLFINGSGGTTGLKLYPEGIHSWNTTNLELKATNDIYLSPGVGDGVGLSVSDPQQILHVKNPASFADTKLRLDNSYTSTFLNQTTQVEFSRGPNTATDYSWFGPSSAGTFDIWTSEDIPIVFGSNNLELARMSETDLTLAGYLKLGTQSGIPSALDCLVVGDMGRMKMDTRTGIIYACVGDPNNGVPGVWKTITLQ